MEHKLCRNYQVLFVHNLAHFSTCRSKVLRKVLKNAMSRPICRSSAPSHSPHSQWGFTLISMSIIHIFPSFHFFIYLFTFNLCVLLLLKWILYKQHIVESFLFIQLGNVSYIFLNIYLMWLSILIITTPRCYIFSICPNSSLFPFPSSSTFWIENFIFLATILCVCVCFTGCFEVYKIHP